MTGVLRMLIMNNDFSHQPPRCHDFYSIVDGLEDMY